MTEQQGEEWVRLTKAPPWQTISEFYCQEIAAKKGVASISVIGKTKEDCKRILHAAMDEADQGKSEITDEDGWS